MSNTPMETGHAPVQQQYTPPVPAAAFTPIQQIQTADVIQIHEWAAELNAAHQLGTALANSNFLPMSLRMKGKNSFKTIDELAADAAAVILAGKSVGLDPMQAVQNIFPVHGMPSMYARTMAALVIAQGHDLVRSEATDDSVTVQARRKGEDRWQGFTWTMSRAAKAGYTSNAKYKSDPIGMLTAKALAEACRLVFPDVLLGMPYSAEDIELDPGIVESDRTPAAEPAKPATRKVTRAPRKDAAPAPEKPPVVDTPPAEDEPAPATDAAPGEEPWRTQWVELIEAMKAAGMQIENPRGKDSGAQWLAKASELAGASWTHPNQISPEAASEVFQMLATPTADEATGEIVDEPTA